MLLIVSWSAAKWWVSSTTRSTASWPPLAALSVVVAILVLVGLAWGSIVTVTSGLATAASASSATVASAALATVLSVLIALLTLAVLLDFTFVDGLLVADVLFVELLLAQHNFEHRDHASELEVVQTFLSWLVLVHDRDVSDLAQLVQALDPVLNQLSQLNRAFDSVRHALYDDVLRVTLGPVQKLVGALEISADADTSLDANLVGWKSLLGLLNSPVLVCHK